MKVLIDVTFSDRGKLHHPLAEGDTLIVRYCVIKQSSSTSSFFLYRILFFSSPHHVFPYRETMLPRLGSFETHLTPAFSVI